MEEQARPQNIVIGQQVQEAKVVRARQMRQEMTTAEAILWEHLRRNGLGVSFRRQQIIDGFIADFYCHSAALVVEVDGPTHDPNYDAERDRIFSERGIAVLRVKNQDVCRRTGFVLSVIRQAIAHSPAKPLPPPVSGGERA